MALLRPTPWMSQPQQACGIDWSNPNTKNLYFACDRFGINYTGRVASLGSNGTLTDKVTTKGLSRGGAGSGYFTGPPHRGIVTPDATGISIVGTFQLGATGQTNKYLAYELNTTTLKQAAIIFGYVANTLEFYCDNYSGTDPRTGSGIVSSRYLHDIPAICCRYWNTKRINPAMGNL